MNDNEPGDVRALMMAEQAVARMDSRLRWRMDNDVRDGLVKAILKTGSPDKFLFRPEPFRAVPSRWSLSGIISRVVLAFQQWRAPSSGKADISGNEALFKTHYTVRRSGAVGMIIALFIALVVGLFGVGEPLELAVQIGRDNMSRIQASGDIVVITKDERSARRLGGMPWRRSYDAQLVDKLRAMGVKRIVFNQIMADPTNQADDMMLAKAFDRAKGKVWLSVQPVQESKKAKWDAVEPLPLFRERTQQAHMYLQTGVFGHVKASPSRSQIGNVTYPAQAEVLAGIESESELIKHNTAFEYNSIPTISAADLLNMPGSDRSLAGKTILIDTVITGMGQNLHILGQGQVPGGYAQVIAAETLKAGGIIELGYIGPLILCVFVIIACAASNNRKNRAIILAGSAAFLVLFMFIGDRLRLHVEIVPALFLIMVIGIREATRSKLIAAMTTHELTGLPNLAHLRYVKGYQKCAVVSVKIERYAKFVEWRPREEQQLLLRAIVARINVIVPDCIVHQGDKGLFVFLVPPESLAEIKIIPEQLHALFTQEFTVSNGIQRIGVSVGIGDDMETSFDARLAVSTDRALYSEYTTLQAVQ